MATRVSADILGWSTVLGSLESGKRADVTVVAGTTGDPYDHLLTAREGDIALVVINDVPRLGTAALFKSLKATQ